MFCIYTWAAIALFEHRVAASCLGEQFGWFETNSSYAGEAQRLIILCYHSDKLLREHWAYWSQRKDTHKSGRSGLEARNYHSVSTMSKQEIKSTGINDKRWKVTEVYGDLVHQFPSRSICWPGPSARLLASVGRERRHLNRLLSELCKSAIMIIWLQIWLALKKHMIK